MAVTVYRTWAANDVLTAADLNASFLRFSVNGQDVGDPRTKDSNMAGFSIKLDADGNTSIRASTNDQIDIAIAGLDRARITASGIFFDGMNLGSAIEIARRIDMRGTALVFNELEDRLAVNVEMSSPGGM